MLADLLLPFPISHPSTVPSDLIHPPLRYGIPLPLFPPRPPHKPSLAHFLLVCFSSCFSSFSSLKPLYILRFGLFSLFYCSPPRASFLLFSHFVNLGLHLFSMSPPPPFDPFLSPSASHPDANDITTIVVSNEYTGRCTRTRYSVGIIRQ